MVGHAAVLELADDAGQATVLFEHLQRDLQHRALTLLRADAKHVFEQSVQQAHVILHHDSTRTCDSTRRWLTTRCDGNSPRTSRPVTQRRWKKSTDRSGGSSIKDSLPPVGRLP